MFWSKTQFQNINLSPIIKSQIFHYCYYGLFLMKPTKNDLKLYHWFPKQSSKSNVSIHAVKVFVRLPWPTKFLEQVLSSTICWTLLTVYTLGLHTTQVSASPSIGPSGTGTLPAIMSGSLVLTALPGDIANQSPKYKRFMFKHVLCHG